MYIYIYIYIYLYIYIANIYIYIYIIYVYVYCISSRKRWGHLLNLKTVRCGVYWREALILRLGKLIIPNARSFSFVLSKKE